MEERSEQFEQELTLIAEIERLKDVLDTLRAENELLREANRWIPVSERLPDSTDWYLCYDGHYVYTERFIWARDWRSARTVTHWRPLPAPPTN